MCNQKDALSTCKDICKCKRLIVQGERARFDIYEGEMMERRQGKTLRGSSRDEKFWRGRSFSSLFAAYSFCSQRKLHPASSSAPFRHQRQRRGSIILTFPPQQKRQPLFSHPSRVFPPLLHQKKSHPRISGRIYRARWRISQPELSQIVSSRVIPWLEIPHSGSIPWFETPHSGLFLFKEKKPIIFASPDGFSSRSGRPSSDFPFPPAPSTILSSSSSSSWQSFSVRNSSH